MEWESGRRLKKATASGKSVSYTYDTAGLRTSKTYNGTKYSYAYAGDKLIWQGWGNEELYFFYNASGEPLEFWHYTNGSKTKTGYYFTNLQGDVVRIEDYSGNVLASYSYDPWGKLLSSSGTYATKNPLRYRGYYYDTETGLYYLQNRYYDPTVSRFINADSYASTGQGFLGYNMFAYCLNDPVSYSDPSGHMMAPCYAWESVGGPLVSPNIMSALGGSAAGRSSTSFPVSSQEISDIGGLVTVIAAWALSASKAEEAISTRDRGQSAKTYYHVTTAENAAVIMASNKMTGGTHNWEGGYVFAWGKYPNKQAIKYSGARTEHSGAYVIISFETRAAFEDDEGIQDKSARKCNPLRSVLQGPINVQNVKIVGGNVGS